MSGVVATVVGVSMIAVGYAAAGEVFDQVKQRLKGSRALKSELNQVFRLSNLKVEDEDYCVEYVQVKTVKQKSHYTIANLSYPNNMSFEQMKKCLPLVNATMCSRNSYLIETKRGIQLMIPRLQLHDGVINEVLLNELFEYYKVHNQLNQYLSVSQIVEHPSGLLVQLNVPVGIDEKMIKQAALEVENRLQKRCMVQRTKLCWSYILSDYE